MLGKDRAATLNFHFHLPRMRIPPYANRPTFTHKSPCKWMCAGLCTYMHCIMQALFPIEMHGIRKPHVSF